jgi:hypothetical protein
MTMFAGRSLFMVSFVTLAGLTLETSSDSLSEFTLVFHSDDGFRGPIGSIPYDLHQGTGVLPV